MYLAKKRLKRSSVQIIGVTGSVGKTTLKEMIYFVMKDKYRVMRSEGNFNTDFGLPLSILQINSVPRMKIFWVWLLIKSFINCYLRNYPYEYLILEYGVDSPGDMDTLTSIAQPQIVVFTLIAQAHMDKGQFKNLKAIWKEKQKIIHNIPANGLVIYNADDPIQKATLKNFEGCQVIPCGKDGPLAIEADNLLESKSGLCFDVRFGKYFENVCLPKVLGKYHAGMVCSVFGLINYLKKLNAPYLVNRLREFSLPPGRMNILPGINDSTIIDSSYNASPVSMAKALEVLKHFPGRKIAALGQMNELGDEAISAHEEVGRTVSQITDILVTVGKLGRIYAKTATKNSKGRPLQIFSFDGSGEAGNFLRTIIKKNDTILVKGSQNMIRMEHLIIQIMLEPEKATSLLVRQDKKWLK